MFLLFLITITVYSGLDDLYLSLSEGSDTNSCEEVGSPCKTVSKVIEYCKNKYLGSGIQRNWIIHFLDDGEFDEFGQNEIRGAYVTFQGRGIERTKIKINNGNLYNCETAISNVVFKNMTISFKQDYNVEYPAFQYCDFEDMVFTMETDQGNDYQYGIDQALFDRTLIQTVIMKNVEIRDIKLKYGNIVEFVPNENYTPDKFFESSNIVFKNVDNSFDDTTGINVERREGNSLMTCFGADDESYFPLKITNVTVEDMEIKGKDVEVYLFTIRDTNGLYKGGVYLSNIVQRNTENLLFLYVKKSQVGDDEFDYTIEDSLIIDNHARTQNSFIDIHGASISIKNSVIKDNTFDGLYDVFPLIACDFDDGSLIKIDENTLIANNIVTADLETTFDAECLVDGKKQAVSADLNIQCSGITDTEGDPTLQIVGLFYQGNDFQCEVEGNQDACAESMFIACTSEYSVILISVLSSFTLGCFLCCIFICICLVCCIVAAKKRSKNDSDVEVVEVGMKGEEFKDGSVQDVSQKDESAIEKEEEDSI